MDGIKEVSPCWIKQKKISSAYHFKRSRCMSPTWS